VLIVEDHPILAAALQRLPGQGARFAVIP